MRPLRIGLLFQKFEGLYQSELVRGMRRAAAELDVHLLCFPGSEPGNEQDFWREFNVAFEFAARTRLDGIISITGTFIWNLDATGRERFFRRFERTPMVSVGRATGSIPVLEPDNRKGMAELMDHFLVHHGYQRLAFICGPADNADARERLEVFRERHAAAGLPLREEWILPGDFYSETGRTATRRLLAAAERPQAIIAANDEMGFAVIATLIENGVRVPQDIAVGGFDDLAALLPDGPPLASVRQDAAGQAALALCMLVSHLREGNPLAACTPVPTRFVARRSCGCAGLTVPGRADVHWEYPEAAEALLGALREAVVGEQDGAAGSLEQALSTALMEAHSKGRGFDDLQHALQLVQLECLEAERVTRRPPTQVDALLDAAPRWLAEQERLYNTGLVLERIFPAWLLSRSLVTRMSASEFTLTGMAQFLAEGLLSLGARNAYLALYPRVGAVRRWDDIDLPEEAQLVLAIRDGEVLSTAELPRFRSAELLPLPLFHEPGYATYALLPLFQRREHYGYLILDVTREYQVDVEQLREAISNFIATVMVVGELDHARELLRVDLDRAQAANEQLAALAEHDVLTGLLNRRGFLSRAEALRAGQPGSQLLISLDMDGLKYINDTFGHAAGDDALRALAQVLRSSFRGGDLIARFGGDEFAVLSGTPGRGGETVVRERLRQRMAAFNVEARPPAPLSASLGILALDGRDHTPIEQHLAASDRLMYADKRQRKLLAPAPAAGDAPPPD
ncbi:GGDEF domain-containing protein [Niveibacterium sp. SC-1]|uniref:GGDEF domain-containing protein n=1 Tax=Niveibacterium sp. SC-1 TaxID=3135646 RepID=UPI00311D308B